MFTPSRRIPPRERFIVPPHRPQPPPPFESMLSALVPTTLLLNSLTRSLGQIDAYPFALSAQAQKKMRFVHEVISERRVARAMQTTPAYQNTQNLPVSDT